VTDKFVQRTTIAESAETPTDAATLAAASQIGCSVQAPEQKAAAK